MPGYGNMPRASAAWRLTASESVAGPPRVAAAPSSGSPIDSSAFSAPSASARPAAASFALASARSSARSLPAGRPRAGHEPRERSDSGRNGAEHGRDDLSGVLRIVERDHGCEERDQDSGDPDGRDQEREAEAQDIAAVVHRSTPLQTGFTCRPEAPTRAAAVQEPGRHLVAARSPSPRPRARGRRAVVFRAVDAAALRRYADLVVEVGVNVQPGQIVFLTAAPAAAPLVRAIAAAAYARGARFVDPWYFDPLVKRARLEHAAQETLTFVPPWYTERLNQLGELRCARISITPTVPPGALDGIDPARRGSIRSRTCRTSSRSSTRGRRAGTWFRGRRRSGRGSSTRARTTRRRRRELRRDLEFVLRLDEADPADAWRRRLAELHDAGRRIDAAQLDAIRFEGPGTNLTVGLLPTSRFAGDSPGMNTVDGVAFAPNLPTEEIAATPDPGRVDGVVTATKPLDISGTVVSGLRVRFEGGRAVEIDAEENAQVLRARAAVDDGASRLGEVALVDREGRIGKTGRVFFNTLLDENAASHIALGNGYAVGVGDEDVDRINRSAIHIDFMIGGDDVAVTGLTRDGGELPLLRNGAWQL